MSMTSLSRACRQHWWRVTRDAGCSRNTSGLMTAAWQSASGAFRALVAGPRFVESQWLSSASPVAAEAQTTFALRDGKGRRIFGASDAPTGETVSRSAAETGLPWTLVVATVQPP